MKTNNTGIHPTLQAKVDDFMQNATPESILADCETMGIKTKPIEGISYQFRNKGQTFWREMADKDDWEFVAQFLPNYERRDDVAFSDDLACVVHNDHEYKDLEWFKRTYTEFDKCSIEDVRQIQEQLDKELFQEAEEHLRHLVQLGSVEVREFPTSIVSARIIDDNNEPHIFLQCADITSFHFGREFAVPPHMLQNVRTRDLPDYDPEINDDWQIQIYYVNKASGDAYWCNAMNIDFE